MQQITVLEEKYEVFKSQDKVSREGLTTLEAQYKALSKRVTALKEKT